MLKLLDANTVGQGKHRSGWPYVLDAIRPLLSADGVLLDDFVERTFLFDQDWHAGIIHQEPWVGVFHQPPDMPAWYLPNQHLQNLDDHPLFQASLPQLKLSIALGDNLGKWLADRYGDVPRVVLRHPTGPPLVEWTLEAFESNPHRKMVQVGWFLRNTQAIYQVRSPGWLSKAHLHPDGAEANHLHRLCAQAGAQASSRRAVGGEVESLRRLDDAEYDRLLAENVIFLELLSAVSNNTVLECIARNAPIVVNRHPGPEYYLGSEYPLFYRHLDQIEALVTPERVLAAHEYLKRMKKPWITGEAFRESLRRACLAHLPDLAPSPGADDNVNSGDLEMNDTPHQKTDASAAGERPIRVLYALQSYPQLSESYVNAEIERMLEWGVHIEAWSEHPPATPCVARVPIHIGKLHEAIEQSQPHVVHAHWTKTAYRYRKAARRMGVPLTVRGHWHFNTRHMSELQADETIARMYLFPHILKWLGNHSDTIVSMPACFYPIWYSPADVKERDLVVRTSATKQAKDLEMFVKVAKRCPDHRFVMILCKLGKNKYFDDLVEFNRGLGSPVEILHDLMYDEVATIIGRAGIYLHTYGTATPFGMPVSIVEAMATGSYLIVPRLDGAEGYVGDVGELYNDEDEAVALVEATTGWSDEQWEEARRRSIDRAERLFRDETVLAPMLEDWKRLASGAPLVSRPTPYNSP